VVNHVLSKAFDLILEHKNNECDPNLCKNVINPKTYLQKLITIWNSKKGKTI
jgi:hypothetical protein